MSFFRAAQLAAVVVVASVAAADEEKCAVASLKSLCRKQVMEAMQHGLAENPEKFVGLTAKSTFQDFQLYFWHAGMHECHRPCMPQEEACVKFSDSYPCLKDVKWAAEVGIPSHPEWYRGLLKGAPAVEIAQFLYTHGQPNCPRPCGQDEEEGHFVLYNQTTSGPDSSTPEPTTSTTKLTTSTWDFQAELDKGVPYSVAHAEWKERREQSEIGRLKKMLQRMGRPTDSPDNEVDDCAKPGVTYAHLDMYGAPAKIVAGVTECHMHCRAVDGAGFFQFYKPLRLCHCVPAGEAQEKQVDENFVGGSVKCGKDSWQQVNEATAQIVQKLSDNCYEVDKSYAPTIGEPLPVYVKSPLACQQELQTSNLKGAAYFSFVASTGACRIITRGATMIPAFGAVSGPKRCKEVEVEAIEVRRKFESREDAEKNISADRVGQKLKAATGILAVTFFSGIVFLVLRRRFALTRDHQLSDKDVEEGLCDADEHNLVE